jgi:hypothetical protein
MLRYFEAVATGTPAAAHLVPPPRQAADEAIDGLPSGAILEDHETS